MKKLSEAIVKAIRYFIALFWAGILFLFLPVIITFHVIEAFANGEDVIVITKDKKRNTKSLLEIQNNIRRCDDV